MRVLFTSLRNTSHFLPLVPFIEACRQGGHEVAVAAPSDLAERAAKTGATFLPFASPDHATLSPHWAGVRGKSDADAMRIIVGEIVAGSCAGAALPGLSAAVQDWQPTLIVRESHEYAAIIAARRAGIPHVRVSSTGRAAENWTIELASPFVDAHGLAAGLPADPSGERIRTEPALTLFPSCFDGEGAEVLRFRAPRVAAPALPDWWPGQTGSFVYATLGTVAGNVEAQRASYRVVLAALAGLPIRALLTVGPDLSLDALSAVPANVHVERFVPQDEVLPHAAAIVCHGGSGTVLGALAAGVPMVVAPLFADQPFNAARVTQVGAGLAVARPAQSPEMRAALLRVLEEDAFRSCARRIAAEMAALPPVSAAVEALERLARG